MTADKTAAARLSMKETYLPKEYHYSSCPFYTDWTDRLSSGEPEQLASKVVCTHCYQKSKEVAKVEDSVTPESIDLVELNKYFSL